ncbi:MAG: acyl carrier protein [Actinomycetes bacterium]
MNTPQSWDEARRAVLDMLAGIAPDQDVEAVAGDVDLRQALDLDSLDFLNFVVGLDEHFGVHTAEADYPELATLDSAVAYLVGRSAHT